MTQPCQFCDVIKNCGTDSHLGIKDNTKSIITEEGSGYICGVKEILHHQQLQKIRQNKHGPYTGGGILKFKSL